MKMIRLLRLSIAREQLHHAGVLRRERGKLLAEGGFMGENRTGRVLILYRAHPRATS